MTSGIITTILLLDADVDPTEYSFQIRAQDSSSASVRSTLVQVTISIIGLNEAIPVSCFYSSYSCIFYEVWLWHGGNPLLNT